MDPNQYAQVYAAALERSHGPSMGGLHQDPTPDALRMMSSQLQHVSDRAGNQHSVFLSNAMAQDPRFALIPQGVALGPGVLMKDDGAYYNSNSN